MLTKTIVVDKRGNKPSLFKLFIRTIARIIPFDQISYLFGFGYGLHDLISNTIVISTKK